MNWEDCKVCFGLCNNQKQMDSDFFWTFQNIVKPKDYVTARGRSRHKAGSLNQIVMTAKECNCDKLLFLDIDMTFPFDVFPRLFNRNLPIVSGLYHLGLPPYSPVAGWLEKGEAVNDKGEIWKYHFSPFPDNNEHLVEVDWTGIGCLLVDMKVFDYLYYPTFYDEWNYQQGDREWGHDVLFCRDIKRHTDLKIYVDTTVDCFHDVPTKINRQWVEAYYGSGMNTKLSELAKENTQTQPYWDSVHFKEKFLNITRHYKDEWNFIFNIVPSKSNVADIGCGIGTLMEKLSHDKKCNCYGYDISSFAIDELKKKGFGGEVVDFTTFSPNGKVYDVVVASHILEHMKDGVGFLERCKTLTSDNGMVIVSVPSNLPPDKVLEHQIQYTTDTLKSTMESVFDKVEIVEIGKETTPSNYSFIGIGKNDYSTP